MSFSSRVLSSKEGENESLSISRDELVYMSIVEDGSSLIKNLSFEGNIVGMDIGGTLIKIVFTRNFTLKFAKFDVHNIEAAIAFVRIVLNSYKGKEKKKLIATGGGAIKYSSRIQDICCDSVEAEFVKVDEMQSLVHGFFFLISNVLRETYTFEGIDESMLKELSNSSDISMNDPSPIFEEALSFRSQSDFFPCLLVNIGSGVSILKISGYDNYERVSGTSLGGGTFCGLTGGLASSRTFDKALELAANGDGSKVDLLVGDIYGTGYEKMGLSSQMIASSFGKAQRGLSKNDHECDQLDHNQLVASKEDMAASILHMITINIGQIAYLNARLHGTRRIYFSGYFIRGHGNIHDSLYHY